MLKVAFLYEDDDDDDGLLYFRQTKGKYDSEL